MPDELSLVANAFVPSLVKLNLPQLQWFTAFNIKRDESFEGSSSDSMKPVWLMRYFSTTSISHSIKNYTMSHIQNNTSNSCPYLRQILTDFHRAGHVVQSAVSLS